MNVKAAFKECKKYVDPKELRNNSKILVNFQEIYCHMMFDTKLDWSFRLRARNVVEGHTVETFKYNLC